MSPGREDNEKTLAIPTGILVLAVIPASSWGWCRRNQTAPGAAPLVLAVKTVRLVRVAIYLD